MLIIILYTIIALEIVTAIIGLIYFNKYKNTRLHHFGYILLYSAINELIAGIFLKRFLNFDVSLFYNIYYVIYFIYLFFVFKSFIVSKRYKGAIVVFTIIYLIILGVNGFYQNYLRELQIIPHIIASCFLIITIIFFYIEILRSSKILQIEKNLLFWISIGLLIHTIGSIPFRILRNYYSDLTNGNVSFLTTVILTLILNFCFIIGFICSDKKQLY